jgi:hypothetical protein
MEHIMRSEYFGQHFRKGQSVIAVILVAMVIMMNSQVSPAKESVKAPRSVVRKLMHISTDKATEHLNALGLSMKINKLENMNAIIITIDNDDDRFKIKSVLNLIDSKLEYEIIRVASDVDLK